MNHMKNRSSTERTISRVKRFKFTLKMKDIALVLEYISIPNHQDKKYVVFTRGIERNNKFRFTGFRQ